MGEGQEPTKTALYDIQAAMGATFMEEGGWWWTDNFGDVDAEYRAVREDVGMWDLSNLIKWDVRGPDATKLAQRVNSHDIVGMQAGQVRYGPFLDEDGLVVDDGTVYKLADDHLWLMTNGEDLVDYFAEAKEGLDVQIENVALQMPHIAVQGPRSRDFLTSLTDADLSSLRYFWFYPDQVKVGGVPVWLSRTGFSGELGYELFVSPENAEDLWRAIHGAGATPFANTAIEVCRIESGLVVTGYDYDLHACTPYDVGLDRFVKLDGPGEFRGKEKLRKVAENPPNRLRTLVLEGEDVPEYGSAVTKDGEPVGTLTSPTKSPRFGVIGLARLRRDQAEEGNTVDVAVGDATAPAKVTHVSVYDPEKRRPRS